MYKKKYYRSSPYSEILEEKKKAYASKYGIDAFKDSWKRQADVSIIFSKMKKKSVRMSSADKSLQTQTKKKRHTTQYMDPKTQSVQAKFQNRSFHQPQAKQSKHLHTKSLFMQKYSEIFQRHKLPSQTKKVQVNSPIKNEFDLSSTFQNDFLRNFEKMTVKDIDSLINLIDTCVKEAQDYISHLSTQMSRMKQQLEVAKILHENLQKELREKTVEIVQKNNTIEHLQKQIQWATKNNIQKNSIQESFEVRKLLEIVSKLKSDNEILKGQIYHMKAMNGQLIDDNVEILIEKKKKSKKQSPKKDYRSQSYEKGKIIYKKF